MKLFKSIRSDLLILWQVDELYFQDHKFIKKWRQPKKIYLNLYINDI